MLKKRKRLFPLVPAKYRSRILSRRETASRCFVRFLRANRQQVWRVMRENCGKRDVGEQENRNGEEERRNPNAEGGNKSEISRRKLKMGYRHFPWKRVGKFLNDVCRFVRAFLSISLFSLSPLFLRAKRRGAQSSSCKFSKGGERRKEGRVKKARR